MIFFPINITQSYVEKITSSSSLQGFAPPFFFLPLGDLELGDTLGKFSLVCLVFFFSGVAPILSLRDLKLMYLLVLILIVTILDLISMFISIELIYNKIT